jgi:thiosulfate reductase cytochrome b subunit
MDPIPQIPQPAAPPQYEFDEAQNRVIDDLAAAMRWTALPLHIFAALGLLAAVLQAAMAVSRGQVDRWGLAAGAFLLAIISLVLGLWLGRAAAAFDRVTETSRYDVTHLMNGLRQMDKFFAAFRLIVQVLVLAALLALVVLLLTLLGQPIAV